MTDFFHTYLNPTRLFTSKNSTVTVAKVLKMTKEQFVETFKHTPKHLIVELLVDLLLKEDADTKVRNKYRDTFFVRHDVVEMLLYIQNNIPRHCHFKSDLIQLAQEMIDDGDMLTTQDFEYKKGTFALTPHTAVLF